MSVLALTALIKDRDIIGQIMVPSGGETYFKQEYPINWSLTPTWKFTDLTNEVGATSNDSWITYSSPNQNGELATPSASENFTK